MLPRRQRAMIYAVVAVVASWLLAWGGNAYFKSKRVTAEKVAAYMRSVELDRLSGEARARALRGLAAKICALSVEDRRRARLAGDWNQWFAAMTESEKGAFIEATLPSGFKQMINSFEQLPEARRKRAIEDALKELRRTRENMDADDPALAFRRGETNRLAELSPALQQRIATIGLKSFYSESSAEAKAELAPVLEELQRLMQSGRLFHGHR